ncbi:hypothetical protein [Minwuia sp.]|uniref:hypothetical protein n=1 Tax=Minwuia sp. TaxID=2493630 RepID=UPI003A8F08F2
MTMTVMVEVFAQIKDPDHERLSVTLSDGQITLQSADGPRLWFSRATFDQIAELVRQQDIALSEFRRDAG